MTDANEPEKNGDETAKTASGSRASDGRFAPGNGGGPGRPKGSRTKAGLLASARRFEELIEAEGEAVVRAVLDAAQQGDMAAARMVLDRIAPPRKGQHVELDLPTIQTVHDLDAAYSRVVEAVAQGEITTDEANALVDLLEARRRAFETLDQEERLRRIEAAQEGAAA